MRLADMNAAEKQRIIDRVEARRAFLASPEVRGWTLGIACGAAPVPALFERYRAQPKRDTHWHTSGWNLIEPAIDRRRIAETFTQFAYETAASSSIRALNDGHPTPAQLEMTRFCGMAAKNQLVAAEPYAPYLRRPS